MKVAIIGCGSVGALKNFDKDYPGGRSILTHAHAAHARGDELFFVDNDPEKLQAAVERWGGRRGKRFAALKGLSIDVVTIAAPTEFHYDIIKEMILEGIRPKCLIVEKPFCNTQKNAAATGGNLLIAEIPTFVNYTRRLLLAYQNLRCTFTHPSIKVYAARLLYTRALAREASHALDLFNWWFGKCLEVRALSTTDTEPGLENDPKFSALLRYERCDSVSIQHADGRNFSLFEIDVTTNKGRIRLVDHGLRVLYSWPVKEPIFDDTLTLIDGKDETVNHCDFETTAFPALYNAVEEFIKTGVAPEYLATSADAIAVHEVIAAIKQSSYEENNE